MIHHDITAMLGTPRPIVLCILDGWGLREDSAYNAIAMAKTPNWAKFLQRYPYSRLETSGLDVGLPEGQMGNSEVGHMNIGSGRVVMQDLPRIDKAVTTKSLNAMPALVDFIAKLKASGGACHLMGLASPGGVHAHIDHIIALANIIAGAGVPVVLHAFLDGRDMPPQSALDIMKEVLPRLKSTNITIGTISGRYYAMDRDNRWERVEKAYNAMVLGDAPKFNDPLAAIQQSYDAGKNDEFVLPVVHASYTGMKDGDGLLMANFRSDRARQLAAALLVPEFDGFERRKIIRFAARLAMVEYAENLNPYIDTLFAPERLEQLLGEVIADAGLKQMRVAETEKYAHVTFFFNGGREALYPGEDRVLIPSPKVETYDHQPAMSAPAVAEAVVKAVNSKAYALIVVNFANTDMVGHTGDLRAAIAAVEAVDECLGQMEEAVLAVGGAMLVTADHGNAEEMMDDHSHQPHTAHTLNPVPFVLVSEQAATHKRNISLENGRLCDIAPSILSLLNLSQPSAMTGHNLIRILTSDVAV